VAATTSSLHSGGRNSPRAPATDDTEAPTDSKIYCRLVDYRLLANGCMLNGSGGTDLLSRFNDVVFHAVSYAFFSMTVGRKAYTQRHIKRLAAVECGSVHFHRRLDDSLQPPDNKVLFSFSFQTIAQNF